MSILTPADVVRLKDDPSADSRAVMAAKVATEFQQQSLDPAERRIAEDIFRTMMRDAELRVREALAENLKSSPDLPHDVAVTLANDVESVALPILRFSEVLSDEDLIEIVGGADAVKQEAIAGRATVSAEVAEALIDTGNERAVGRLVTNQGAELSEGALNRVMTVYEDSETVATAMSERPSLPAAVSEQLMSVVTQHLQKYLVTQQRLPPEMVRSMVVQARERATAGLLTDGCATEAEVAVLIDQLEAKGRLSASMALQALSNGDLTFFEMAMARLAGIPHENAQTLIHDEGKLGLKSILKAANC